MLFTLIILVPSLAGLLLAVWGYFIRRRHGRFAFLIWLPAAGVLFNGCCTLGIIIVGLSNTWNALGGADLDPSERSEQMSVGFSNAFSAGLVVPVAILAVSLVLNLVFQWREVDGAHPDDETPPDAR